MRAPLIIASLALTLGACAGFPGSIDVSATHPVEELRRADAKPDRRLIDECRRPVALPNRAMSAGEVDDAWEQDRISLVVCGRKHKSLIKFYGLRDRGLSGEAR